MFVALCLEVPVILCYFSIFPFGNIDQYEVKNEKKKKISTQFFLPFDKKLTL